MAIATWDGTIDPNDGRWDGSANWVNGIEPGLTDTAIINNGTIITYRETVGSLIMNNAALNIIGGLGALLRVGLGTPGVISGGLVFLDTNARFIAGDGITSATGTVRLGLDATYVWNGANSTQIIHMEYRANPGYPDRITSTFTFSTQFDGTIETFYASNTIIYSGAGTVTGMTINGHTVTYITTAGNYTITFDNQVNMADLRFNTGTGSITTLQVDPNVPCFVQGTLIRTERGDIAVENLEVGDMAVTPSGAHRPIIWLGHCTMQRMKSPNFESSRPVRVQAGAFGERMPYADLWLSPGHAVCVHILEEVLIPVGYLINGATIAQMDIDEVTYWHVELDSHDILIANGLPAESYLDCGTRTCFHDTCGTVDPDRRLGSPEDYCRPLILDSLTIEAVAGRLRARAEQLGWTRTTDMDIHLVADGVRIDPDIDEGVARFLLPAHALNVRLQSETFIPAEWSETGDARRLGISIHGLHIDDGLRCRQDINIDDPRLDDGFHYLEAEDGKSWRWTNGSLKLPSELWADCKSHVFLRVTMNTGGHPRWVASSKGQMQQQLRLVDEGRADFIPLRVA